MKKSLLFLVSLALTVSGFAQPAKPTVAYTSFADAVTNAEDVYLYNVEAELFMTNGNYWGTRAAVVNNGKSGSGNYASFEDFLLGNAEAKGCPWKILEENPYEVDGNTVYCYSFSYVSGSGSLSADGADGIWVDGDNSRPVSGWFVSDLGSNTFRLGYIASKTEGEGEEATTVYYQMENGWLGVQKLKTEGNTNTLIDASTVNTTWALVTADEYERVQPLLGVYHVGKALKEALDAAKEQGISADFSSYEALLSNPETTREEYAAAYAQLGPKVALGQAISDAKALDAAHDWSAFETIYKSETATTEEVNAAVALVKAYVSLKKVLDEATKNYATCDFSEPKATYDNTASTTEDLAAAEKQIAQIIAEYEMAQASLDNPADITETIDYVTDLSAIAAGNGVVPKAGWTSTKQSGNFHINTWSVEGDPGNDGSNMTTPFIEYWKAKGNLLDDQKFYRDPEKWPFDVKAGAYKITANARLYNESGATYMEGAYMFGNITRTCLTGENGTAIEGAQYLNYNSMLGYWKDGFETYAIVPEDGTLTFGFQTEGANFNWLAAKDFHVYYLGTSLEAMDYVRKNTELTTPAYGEETKGTKSLLDEYAAARAAYEKAATADEISKAYGTLMQLVNDVEANVAAYKVYSDSVQAVIDYLAENDDLAGDDLDRVLDYVSLDYTCGPESEDATYWKFSNGAANYILDNCTLTTEEIKAETAFLTKILDDAIKNALQDGSSLTSLIKNPGFEEAGGTGWSLDTHDGTCTSSLTNWHGGNATNYCAEAYMQNFDVYQVIEGVPDGLYEVSVQAFYRSGKNEDAYAAYAADPDLKDAAKVYSEVYFNEFSTPIRNVMEIQFADGELDANNTNTYATPDGTYTLDGMTSASNAFSLENPERNFTMSAYGLVTDGKIRLGIRRLNTPPSNDFTWTLWDNFKLTYRAKNPEVIAEVLDAKVAELEAYLEENEDNMTTPANEAAAAALKNAEKPEDIWEALIKVNNTLVESKANVAAVEEFNAAKDEMEDALDEGNPIGVDAYTEIEEDVTGGYLDMTTEEVEALTAKVTEVTKLLNIPIFEDATNDNPVACTSMLVNPDFEKQSAEGWTLDYAEGDYSNLRYESASYDGEASISHFVNAWKNGAALGNGKIYQDVTGLPAGTYTLGADVIATWQADASATVNGAYLFIEEVGVSGAKMYTPLATENNSPKSFDVTIYKNSADTSLRVGIMTHDTNANWLAADNFELFYLGTDIPTAIDGIITTTAKKANGKYLENGRIVIIKNGVKYNVAGQMIK